MVVVEVLMMLLLLLLLLTTTTKEAEGACGICVRFQPSPKQRRMRGTNKCVCSCN
jgi:hypothetical protein